MGEGVKTQEDCMGVGVKTREDSMGAGRGCDGREDCMSVV